jgi:alkylation response protein AidB-like acyl-CoA dehydrogenase
MLGGIDRSQDLFDSLLGLAKRAVRNGRPAIEAPWVRDRLAALKAELEVQRYSSQIQLTRELNGEDGGLLEMMNKLVQSNFAASIAEVSSCIIEDDGLISPIDNPRPGNERWVNQYMNSLATAIAGGTSNIQRNIIAERGLGLPREAAPE